MDHSSLKTDELKALKLLRSSIKSANILSSKIDKTVNIATWNIRHWGQKKRYDQILHHPTVTGSVLSEKMEVLNFVKVISKMNARCLPSAFMNSGRCRIEKVNTVNIGQFAQLLIVLGMINFRAEIQTQIVP